MVQDSERQQRIHIQQVFHGKSARSSPTCALVSLGAFGPAVSAGKPVTGSRIIRPFRGRVLRGVRTMHWPSSLASSKSPGCRSSLRRMRLGTTTCPFVESLVCMVRQSYHPEVPVAQQKLRTCPSLLSVGRAGGELPPGPRGAHCTEPGANSGVPGQGTRAESRRDNLTQLRRGAKW